MGISEIRKQNLRLLIEKETGGNVAEFCRNHNLNDIWLRQILTNPNKNLGEKAARKFEKQIGLPNLSLDASNPKSSKSSIDDIEKSIQNADFLSADQKSHFIGILKTLTSGETS